MVVECEGCGTRFNLADGQVPPGGARVRCSKCHHRFVVTPSGEPASGSGRQDSPPPRDSGREEPNLDNPEFLFDGPNAADDSMRSADGDRTQNPDLEQTQLADAPGGFGDSGSFSDEEARGDDEDDDEEVFGDEEPDSVPSLAPAGRHTPTQVTATQAMDLAPGGDLGEGIGDRSEFGGHNEMIGEDGVEPAALDAPPAGDLDDLGDDWDGAVDDDPMGSWDSLLDGAGSAPRTPAAASRVETPREASGPGVQRATAADASPEPHAGGEARLRGEWIDGASRVLAVVAGLLLTVGGVRAVSQNAMGLPPGPGVVRGAGWAAQEIDSLQLRDAAGRRVVVVRGSLSAPVERNVPPYVRAVLLDAGGDSLGSPIEAWLERLNAEQLTPEALSRRLASASRRAPGSATGFTILIPDPPVEARRFELRLEPRS